METDIIWILLFIGYAIGLIPMAILGIMGCRLVVWIIVLEVEFWQVEHTVNHPG